MNIKQLFAEEDAVSPVIGVILMVAITVILAAVIGTFVLGLGENVQDSSPQANFQFEYDDGGDGYADGDDTASSGNADGVTVTHTGGEDVDADNVAILIDGLEVGISSPTDSSPWSGTISTGTEYVAYEDETDVIDSAKATLGPGETVRVVWTSPSGGTSQTIGQSTVPS